RDGTRLLSERTGSLAGRVPASRGRPSRAVPLEDLALSRAPGGLLCGEGIAGRAAGNAEGRLAPGRRGPFLPAPRSRRAGVRRKPRGGLARRAEPGRRTLVWARRARAAAGRI